MTWSARFTDSNGNVPEGTYSACQNCKHGQTDPNRSYHAPCNLPSAGSQLASLLTSIDVGCDGHMAGGSADLKCYGYEPK
jgi:hypothetical protein